MRTASPTVLLVILITGCAVQRVAPDDELRAATQSLRRHGITVDAPADMREDYFSTPADPRYSRSYAWTGQRVWIGIEACTAAKLVGGCTTHGRDHPRSQPRRLGARPTDRGHRPTRTRIARARMDGRSRTRR